MIQEHDKVRVLECLLANAHTALQETQALIGKDPALAGSGLAEAVAKAETMSLNSCQPVMGPPDEKLPVLEHLLANVNAELLRAAALIAADPALAASEAGRSLVNAEKVSRYRRLPLPRGRQGYDYAFARADLKAKHNGETFVVLEKAGDDSLIVMPKARLLSERPFGLGEQDIIHTAEAKA